jgi:hypothetical protein
MPGNDCVSIYADKCLVGHVGEHDRCFNQPVPAMKLAYYYQTNQLQRSALSSLHSEYQTVPTMGSRTARTHTEAMIPFDTHSNRTVTTKQFYAYMMMHRIKSFNRLFQQYYVDMWTAIETVRLQKLQFYLQSSSRPSLNIFRCCTCWWCWQSWTLHYSSILIHWRTKVYDETM